MWSLGSTSHEPPARKSGAMTTEAPTGRVVLFGGVGRGELLDDTWAWDGHGWHEMHPAVRPSGRLGAAFAYDERRRSAILFGGRDASGQVLGDTWLWDGKTWHETRPPSGPCARALAAMAYDSARQTVVLFGGADSNGRQLTYVGDTWLWNGRTWTQVAQSTSPTARGAAAMAYHRGTKKLLMFGGGNGAQLGDTWTWDGDWVQLRPGLGPSARSAAAVAEHAELGSVFLFGGWSGTSDTPILNDFWSWNGTAWVQHASSESPPPTYGGNLAYDRTSHSLVLFGSQGSKRELHPEKWAWK